VVLPGRLRAAWPDEAVTAAAPGCGHRWFGLSRGASRRPGPSGRCLALTWRPWDRLPV